MKLFAAALVVTTLSAGSAIAQTDRSFPACPSQQQLEQVLGSKGKFTPDECRKLTVTRVQSADGDICVLDFETGGDPGFIDQLRSAAVPSQWWVACENLPTR